MELWTDELEQKALGYPIQSQDKKGKAAKVLVKYFNPYGAGTWLITEAEKQENGDWLLFGYCHIFEWEWGYVLLSELTLLMLLKKNLWKPCKKILHTKPKHAPHMKRPTLKG